MNGEHESIQRFSRRHVVNHWIMLITFVGLVLTGLPQKFPHQEWAKGVVLIFGSVARVRVIHHALGTVMALQLVWHGLELVWLHFVRRLPMAMLPATKDISDFMTQVRFNLGSAMQPPRMGRYTFAEKIEYLALVWGTALMVGTGLILLFPVTIATLVPGEAILAAKAAHGGEAILALLSILTWHVYFVHVRHWNRSIFTRQLGAEEYAEEHPEELEAIRTGEVAVPAPLETWRLAVFGLVTVVTILAVSVLVLWLYRAGLHVPTIRV